MLMLFWAWFPVLLLFVFSLIFGFVPVLLLRISGMNVVARKLSSFTARWVSLAILKVLNIKVSVSGFTEQLKRVMREKKVCYISNHTSILDIPVLEGPLGLGCGFILKRPLAFFPVINIVALALECVFIDRGNLKKSIKAIEKGVKKIQDGRPMLIFPEGTRSKTGRIGRFKHGSFRLATKSSAVLVPIAIKGVRSGFESRKCLFKKIHASVYVGEPVETAGLDREQIYEMEQTVEKLIVSSYNALE